MRTKLLHLREMLAAPPAPLDGSLLSWPDVERAEKWQALFLGNGLSINVWPGFDYRSLFEQANMRGGLSAADQALFDAHGTTNFEVVLAALNTSITTLKSFHKKTGFLLESYRSIQAALGEAVRDVHPHLMSIPEYTRAT